MDDAQRTRLIRYGMFRTVSREDSRRRAVGRFRARAVQAEHDARDRESESRSKRAAEALDVYDAAVEATAASSHDAASSAVVDGREASAKRESRPAAAAEVRAASYLIHATKSSADLWEETEADLLPKRLERMSFGKGRAMAMASWLREEVQRDDLADRLVACNLEQVYREWLETGHTRLFAAQFCHISKLCPICAGLRAAKAAERYAKRIAMVLAEREGSVPYMLTFTVKSGSDLRERLGHVLDNVTRMLDSRRKWVNGNRGYSWTPLCSMLGGVTSCEVKRGRGGHGWHPHVHILGLCDGTWEPSGCRSPELEALWFAKTGDSHVVDVRRLHGETLMSGVEEVLKYTVKLSGMDCADAWEAYMATASRRLLRSWGILKGMSEPNILTDDLPTLGPEAVFVDRVFRYMQSQGRYEEQE